MLVGDSVAMCSGVLLPPPPPVDPPPPDVPPPEVLAPPPQPESRIRTAKAMPSGTVRAMFVKCLMLVVGRRCAQGKLLRSLQGWGSGNYTVRLKFDNRNPRCKLSRLPP